MGKKPLVVGALLAGTALLAWTIASRDAPSEREDRSAEERPPPSGAGLRVGAAAGTRARISGARIVGTVTRGGKPVAARVEARPTHEVAVGPHGGLYVWKPDGILEPPPSHADARASTRAGADGRFVLQDLGPSGWLVVAVTDEGALGSVDAEVSLPDAVVEVAIDVSVGSETLRGRASHADGSPWRGLVCLYSARAEPPTLRLPLLAEPTPTDAEGRFSFSALFVGEVQVTALEPGALRTRGATIAIPYEGEYALTVDAGFVPFQGRVIADRDGSPVAGADVVVSREAVEWSEVAVRATTAADGTFRVATLPSRGSVSATARGFHLGQARLLGGQQEVEIRLSRPARIAGRVTSEDGRPVPGAPVGAATRLASGFYFPDALRTRTDGDGRFELDGAAPGELLVYVLGGGWISKGLPEVRDEGPSPLVARTLEGETTTIDLTVVPAARVEGSVADAHGEPVEGATVRATAGHRAWGYLRMGWLLGRGERTSGPGGVVSFDTFLPGMEYEVEAAGVGVGSGSAGPVVPTFERTTHFEISLPPPRWVDVAVVAERTGAPVEGVLVSAARVYDVKQGRGTWGPDVAGARSGADGHARVGPLPAGTVAVSAVTDRGIPVASPEDRKTVEGSSAGATEMTARLSVPSAGPARGLAGRVLFADGSPAVGCTVSEGREDVRTDAKGEFRLWALGRHNRRVHARLRHVDGTFETRVEVPEDASEITIVFPPATGGLLVRLVGEDAVAVYGARGVLRSPRRSQGLSFERGKTRLEGTVPDGATIEVWAPVGADGRRVPLGPASIAVDPRLGELVIALPPERRIEGHVLGPDGQGVEGVEVRAFPASADADVNADPHGSARSTAGGWLSIGSLSGETYRLVVTPDAYFQPRADVVTASGGTGNVDVPVRRAAVAAVTVLDAEGRPVVRARVEALRVERSEGRRTSPAEGETDALGVVRLQGLDPAERHTLRVDPPMGREDLLLAEVEGWIPLDTTVRMGRAFQVAGVVLDASGAPAPGVRVQRRMGPMSWTWSVTDEAGKFRFVSVPAGDVVLRVDLASSMGISSRSGTGPEIAVRAGDENVVLHADLGAVLTLRLENEGAAEPEFPRMPSIYVQLTPEGTTNSTMHSGRPGLLRIPRLDPKTTYVLWATAGSGLSAYERGVRVDSEIHLVRLKPGRAITGRLNLPRGATRPSVTAVGPGLSKGGKVEEGGTFRVENLPEGTWTLEGRATVEGAVWKGSAQVAAGESAEILLTWK